MKAALFVRKDTALKAGIALATKRGVPHTVILAKTRVVPVIKRGEMKGYQCRYPVSESVTSIAMEHHLEARYH